MLASLAAYLVVGLDVQLDLFAGEGADSGWGEDWSAFLCCCFWGMRFKGDIYLICMVGEVVVVVCVLDVKKKRRDSMVWWWGYVVTARSDGGV